MQCLVLPTELNCF